jgi:hypothetical protein
MQVVDPHDERALLASTLHDSCDAAMDRLAQRRDVRAFECRREAEQVGEHLDELRHLGVVGWQSEQAARLHSCAPADVVGRACRVERHVRAERRRDGEPDVALAIGGAHPLHDTDRGIEVGEHLVDETRLADAALAEDVEQQPARLAERELHGRVSQRELAARPTRRRSIRRLRDLAGRALRGRSTSSPAGHDHAAGSPSPRRSR